ncbi:MAG TPA: hypothetical protein VLH94_04150 [Spirochaetia bacterium]|nr:hypothetical protein [Spirochaetia bacterium]
MSQEIQNKLKSLIERINNLRAMGSLPALTEGITRIENQVKTIGALDSNSNIPEDRIIAILDDMSHVLHDLERLAGLNKRLATNKWRLK